MKRIRSLFALLVIAVCMASCTTASSNKMPQAPTLFLVGDSTMADQMPDHFPQMGWGQMLPAYVKSGMNVENHAKNGRSTKSFRDEGRWRIVLQRIKPGDYVVMGFGHNDQKIEDPSRYAEPWSDYHDNLTRFINEAQAKGAQVTLVTPIRRRDFDAQGKLQKTLGDYPAVTRKVAEEQGVALVDLNELTAILVQDAGVEGSKLLYTFTAPGAWPNLPPEGRQDNTHMQVLGAAKVAALFAADVKRQNLPLAHWMKK